MKCLNCGCENNRYICQKCLSLEILDELFYEIAFYSVNKCKNPYLIEYVTGLEDKMARRDLIPKILSYFTFEDTEYYHCLYYKISNDSCFENSAITYLDKHNLEERSSQRVLYELINYYVNSEYNFVKPKKWCEFIFEDDNLCCELYEVAADYFSKIGEYDISDSLANRGIACCDNSKSERLIFRSAEKVRENLENQKNRTTYYREKRPYWPKTDERQRAVAMFYDEKGIEHPLIKTKAKKIKEADFLPLNECFKDELKDYCAFWCSEAFSLVAAKPIYQIAAVKVRNGEIINEFQSLIRPWDGEVGREDAARKAKVELSVIEGAEDVDQVMKKFFDFVGDDVLVSTGALGNQAKLISRAARYAGMREIKNEFYDLLDLAADTSEKFDLANNTREYLITYFSIVEGKSALEKAKVNIQLHDYLRNYGK